MLQKLYNTKTSSLILNFIKNKTEQGFTAFELLDFLKSQNQIVNKTTVYRNIDKLVANGQLLKRKSTTSDAYMYFYADLDKNCKSHIHLQCISCGTIYHLCDTNTREYLNNVSDNFDFQIDFPSSVINGICKKCNTN
ncbi:MAG: Fur family transcriptional regulator [Treponemataceae bacterium]